VFSMHMIMHLEHHNLEQLLKEVHRILKHGGHFIFDFPSQKRRDMFNTRPKNWHGANAYKIEDIVNQIHEIWSISNVCGIMFLPIHRIPARLRPMFHLLDKLLCRSFLKNYSSYLIVSLTKK
jgi:SAM-dependent methyltransferase